MISKRDRLFYTLLWVPLVGLMLYFLSLLGAIGPYFESGTFFSTLTSKDVLSAIRISLLTATVSTMLALVFATPVAYALSRFNFTGKHFVDSLLDIPMLLTPVALGTLLLMFFNSDFGRWLEQSGISVTFTLNGVILAQFTVIVAIAIRLLKSTFDDISPRYEQVARTLGCSATRAFIKVTLPMARNGILAAIILTWARAIAEFGATVTLAGTAKGKTATLPTSIYLAMASADLEQAVVLIVIMISLAFSVLLMTRFFMGEGRT